MSSSFIHDLKQFSLSVDIVDQTVMEMIGKHLHAYFFQALGVSNFEIREPGGSTPHNNRYQYLTTLWPIKGTYTAPLYKENGQIRGQSSYAVIKNKNLWIVDKTKDFIRSNGKSLDLWSEVSDLPPYEGGGDGSFRTAIIVPFGSPTPIGFINLEFKDYLEPNPLAQKDFESLAESIGILYKLRKTQQLQRENTQEAVRSLNPNDSRSPLRKAKLFFAFSSKADAEVVGEINRILDDEEYAQKLEVTRWNKINTLGIIPSQLKKIILDSDYGICYLSEFDKKNNQYIDNPNVIFEAGMFQAQASSDSDQSRWLPIREANSGSPPFDLASERILSVERNDSGELNTQSFQFDLRNQLDALIT